MRVAHLLRKPITEGSIARNALEHGTGGINIDGTRVKHQSQDDFRKHEAAVVNFKARGKLDGSWKNSSDLSGANPVREAGRWPANLVFIHTPECRKADAETWKCTENCPSAALDDQSGFLRSGLLAPHHKRTVPRLGHYGIYGKVPGEDDNVGFTSFGDAGYASRYFARFQADHDCLRASQDTVCESCGQTYGEHPEDYRYVYEGQTFLHVLCDGTRVKL